MARIPRVQPGTATFKESTISPVKMRDEGVGTGQGLEVLGGAVEKTSNALYAKLDEARNYVEAGQYEGYKARTMAALKFKAENDTYTDPEGKTWLKQGTPEDFKPYTEALSKAKQDAGKFFTNKDQQAKAMADWDRNAAETEAHVANVFMKNIAKNGDATTRETLNDLSNVYDGSPEAEKMIGDTINQAVAHNIYDPAQAYTLKEKTLKEARWNMFNRDRSANPTVAQERLDKNVYKFDPTEAEKARTIFDRDLKKMQGDTEDGILLNDLNGKPNSKEDLIAFANTGKIRPEFAQSKIKAMENPGTTKTDIVEYERLMTMISDPNTKSADIRQSIVDAFYNKKITESDYMSLLYGKKLGHDTSVFQEYLDGKNKPNGNWGIALNILKNFTSNFAPVFTPMLLMKDVLNIAQTTNATEKELPGIAKQVVEKKAKESNPFLSLIPKAGQMMVDAFGNMSRVYPDGSTEQEGQKSSIWEEGE